MHFNFLQVFFRAGILGDMEELRDERIGKLITWLQSWVRGYKSRKYYSKMQKQRVSLLVVQRNLRKYMVMRSWLWYALWITIKPTLKVSRAEDELADLEAKAEKAEKQFEKENKARLELEALNNTLQEERNGLLMALDSAKGGMSEFMEKQEKLQNQKQELEAQLTVSTL